MPISGDQATPLVHLQVEADNLYGHAEYGRSGRGDDLILEDLQEP
ncbi:MAG: hypothetical protein ACRDYE_07140 [Acidimicrobiales bacterium]